MRRFCVLASFALLAGSAARAQIDFSAALPNKEILICDSVPVVVTLRNSRAEPLRADDASGYSIAFEVSDDTGLLLRPRPEASIPVPAEVPAFGEVVFTNDLQQVYALAKSQTLGVRARLTLGNRTYVTDKMFAQILPGLEIARLQASSPAGGLHTFTLRTLNRDKRDRLFIRSDNEAGTVCYGVSDLGRFVRIRNPTLEVDSAGRAHVLHLTGPNQFIHSVFTPDGLLLSRNSFEGDLSLVRLEPDGQGAYRVVGAGRITPAKDPLVEPLPVRRGL